MDSWVSPTIAALWGVFLATHMGLSSQALRPKLVNALGAGGFLAGYSAVALSIFVPLAWIYSTHKHAGAFLWYGSEFAWMRPVAYLGMALAVTLVVGAFLDPSPASLSPGTGRLKGVLRITRHPLFMGVALFGLLHLCVARVHVADLVFFGGLPIVGLIGCWHQDRRNLATGEGAFREFYGQTAFLPFARGGIRGLFDAPVALVVGIGLTVLVRFFHPMLFGGA
jgi:uncharacterized membrane protein